MPAPVGDLPLNDAAHVIQVALTPVFLLSGIGTLLNVFNTRLSRVSDHAEHVTELLAHAESGAEGGTEGEDAARMRRHLTRLGRRTSVLDSSIVLGALGGCSTCGAAFVLFIFTARDAAGGWVLFLLFGAALGFIVGALLAFLVDSVLAWHGLRKEGALPRPKTTAPRG